MNSTAKLSNNKYYELSQNMDFNPASYKEVEESFMENGVKEMYHALVDKEDILTMFKITNLKIFWICRCHHVAVEKSSTSYEHLHALVQYQNNRQLLSIVILWQNPSPTLN